MLVVKKALLLSSRRKSPYQQSKAEVEESVDAIKQFKQQIADAEKRREETIAEINDRWGSAVNEITEVTIAPKKTDVFVKLFGVAWMPYYVVRLVQIPLSCLLLAPSKSRTRWRCPGTDELNGSCFNHKVFFEERILLWDLWKEYVDYKLSTPMLVPGLKWSGNK